MTSLTLLALALSVFLAGRAIDLKLRPALIAWAGAEVTTATTKAISEAISLQASSRGSAPLVTAETNPHNQTTILQYDFAALNAITNRASAQIIEQLAGLSARVVPMPLGELTGLSFLAALGPYIPVRILATHAVTTNTRFSFQSAGINQVIHHVFLTVDVNVRVVAPLIAGEFPVHKEIPLSGILISGAVPNVFVNWSGNQETLMRAAQSGLLGNQLDIRGIEP